MSVDPDDPEFSFAARKTAVPGKKRTKRATD